MPLWNTSTALALAGGTLTGALLFSGTGHAGIALNNLTTTQRDAVASPASGSLILNTTTARPEFYNSAAWHGVGVLDLANTWSVASASGAPAAHYTGAWITGLSATLNKPHCLIEPTGTTSTGWSTLGTGLGINAASGFTGRLFDLQIVGKSGFAFHATSEVDIDGVDGTVPDLRITGYGITSSGGGGTIHLRGARGVKGTPTAAQSGDLIGGIGGKGYTGSIYPVSSPAAIHFLANANFGAADYGTTLRLLATAAGATSRSVAADFTGAKGILYQSVLMAASGVETATINASSQLTVNSTSAVVATASFVSDVTGASGGAGMVGYLDSGSAVGDASRLGYLFFGGATDASHSVVRPAGIASFATENWTGAATGCDLRFYTTINAGATRTQRWSIENNGHLFASLDNAYDIGASGGTRPANIYATQKITSIGATHGIGYATGAGGTVTQITSRSTGVTLSKVTGQITTTADSLAGLAQVTFTVTNTAVAATDTIILSKVSGDADTECWVNAVASGSFNVTLRNNHAVDADVTAFVFNFAVIKGVTS